MSWRKATFKGKDVWAEVDALGAPVVQGGRTPIRYSNKSGARIYRGGASAVRVDVRSPVEALPAGVSADAAPAAPAKGKSKRGSGFGKAGTRTRAQAALAEAAAISLIDSLPSGTVIAFTDGACKGNPGPAGSGAVVRFPDGRVAEACKSLGTATNNVGELTAIWLALHLLEESGIARTTPVALLTDSQYCNGVLVLGWKAKANKEIIDTVRAKLAQWPNLRVHWIAGHVGIEGNELADTLANAAVGGVTDVRWSTGE
ncbi:MAG: reverse transcriptase-like protein [Deltaproteobacteria bacterium]|nr:MAG: reverse transcriptase-like protein [Deltaproteobacteria bacterium]